MPRFICSLPNERDRGRVYRLISDDPAAIAAFVRRHDVPGRGVYECVGELRPGAQHRRRETIGRLHFLHVDVDLRHLTTPRDKVLAKLKTLPLRAELRDSGGGFHVIFNLKEPVEADTPEFERANELRTRLTHLLCGDPVPNHCAALLRMTNTTNTKYGDARLCQVIQDGEQADITEIERLLDEYGDAPLFAAKPKGNGHDTPGLAGDYEGPVDVDARLEAMTYQGGGNSGVHNTLRDVSASLLRAGVAVDEVRDGLLEAVHRVMDGDPRAANWNWDQERQKIEGLCFDFISYKHPELYYLLPDDLGAKWRELAEAGRALLRVTRHRPASPWYVTSRDGGSNNADATGGAAESGDTHSAAPNDQKKKPDAAKTEKKIRAVPFELFDEAALPRRAHLYAKHYQRGQCTATIGCDGAGKSTVGIGETVVMATCRNLLGEQPEQRCRVWLHNADDDTRRDEPAHRRVLPPA
jgi:AAA domain